MLGSQTNIHFVLESHVKCDMDKWYKLATADIYMEIS